VTDRGSGGVGAGAQPTNAPDDFANAALKFRALLGATAEDRVLLAGPLFADRQPSFGDAFAQVRACGDERAWRDLPAGTFDLVFLDLRQHWSGTPVAPLVTAAGARLAAQGSLVMATAGSAGNVIRACRRAGLAAMDLFLAMPDHAEPEEYVATGGTIELPSYARLIDRAAAALGLYQHLHRDRLLIASAGTSPLVRFAARVAAVIAAPQGARDATIVDRFALRERGALVVMLRVGPEGVVVRGGVTASVMQRLDRNREFTDRIHALSALDTRHRALVPRSLGRFESGGGGFLVERRMPGMLAWKLRRGSAPWDRVLAESVIFIEALGQASGERRLLDDAAFDRLVGDDLRSLEASFTGAAPRRDLSSVGAALRAALGGREARIVWGHGDYGFGNLLCDPTTGALTGVIDWDTHVETELEGVDRANLLFQLEATVPGRRLADGYRALLAHIPAEGRSAAALAALRMIRRSTTYRAEFARLEGEYAALLAAVAAGGPGGA
jgi:hypothetical protein